MWLITQQADPDDYVLATGETRSVREFVEEAFAQVGKKVVWRGSGVDEKGLDARSGRILVEVDPRYFRPTEAELLIGDSRIGTGKTRLAPQCFIQRASRGNGASRS